MTDASARYSVLEIGGKKLCLLLNLSALTEICDKYGDIETLSDRLDNSSWSKKLNIILDLIEILSSNGYTLHGEKEGFSTMPSEVAMDLLMPYQIEEALEKIMQAINAGMVVDYDGGADTETDEVLQEIEKNAESAAGS